MIMPVCEYVARAIQYLRRASIVADFGFF